MKDINTWIEHLNPEQRAAVMHGTGPCLVLAGAGSGKTRVLTVRIARLLAEGVAPSEIMAVTFTNKAAREMRERVIDMAGSAKVGPVWKSDSLFLGTFHSWGAAFLRRHHERLGWKEQFTILDADDALKEIKAIVNARSDKDLLDVKRIRGIISDAKNALLDPRAFAETVERGDDLLEAAAEVYAAYDAKLQEMHAADFDDLLRYPVQLLRAHDTLREAYQRKVKYVLVDEYQDTNAAQDALLRLVVGPERNIMVVGDDAQAIYGWRGSRVDTILEFDRNFPGTNVVRLEQNYRSTKAILGAANALLSHNVKQSKKSLWTQGDEGEGVTVIEAEDDLAEARYVVEWIVNLMSDGVSSADIAVLYRTNAQSRLLEQALSGRGIAYTVVGGLAFYERREVKDVLAYARVLVNPEDDNALERVINVPKRSIGPKALDLIRAEAKRQGVPLRLALSSIDGLSKGAQAGVTELRNLLEKLEEVVDGPPDVLLQRIAKETGLLQALRSEGEEGLDRIANVEQLVAAAAEFVSDRSGQATLSDFLANAALVQDADSVQGKGVTLMTLHTSKGLEFPAVAVTGLEEGTLPHGRSIGDPEALEEERRLFYVGLTRARARLLVGYAKRRRQGREYSETEVSRFVSEMGPTRFVRYSGTSERMPWHRGNFARRQAQASREVEPDGGFDEGNDWLVGEDMAGRKAPPPVIPKSQRQGDVGRKIVHAQFGQGVVRAALGSGGNAQYVVEFADGRKRVVRASDVKAEPLAPGLS